MRLIINNILLEQDKNAIITSTTENPAIVFDLSDIAALRDTLLGKASILSIALRGLFQRK
jgi:hypothetical protein